MSPPVQFRVDWSKHPVDGSLRYIEQDCAFTVEPRPSGCVFSVGVNELELMVDEDNRRVMFVEGYCPYHGWQSRPLGAPPRLQPGALYVVFDREPVPGGTVGLTDREHRWPVLVDPHSGWIRLGQEGSDQGMEGVAFAPGVVAVIESNQLKALWLRPEALPTAVRQGG